MATKCDEDKRVKSKSTAANHSKDDDKLAEAEAEAEEESLSLSDLPINNKNQNHEKSQQKLLEGQEDFNFNSCGASFLQDSQMCAADEVFFKGKLLPFRHSISSETGLTMFHHDIPQFMSRSQSMDHRYTSNSTGSPSGSTTRSSSIRSSLSSGSTSTGTIARVPPLLNQKPPRVRIRNQFHSHPSPTPQIRLSTSRRGNTNPSHHQWSQKLRFFHMGGSVQTQEIKIADLKIGRNNSTMSTGINMGSRNSNSSTGSSNSSGTKVKLKKKYLTFFNECKCRVDDVDQTVGRRLISVSKNSSSSSSCVHYQTIGGEETKKKKEKGKQAMSHHRTFEWLKQIADVNGGADSDELARSNN